MIAETRQAKRRRKGDKAALPVSDRAVLRWLQRHGFVDVEAVREQIYRETREALNSGASKVTVNGTQYRIRNGMVVTLVDRRKAGAPLKWPRQSAGVQRR